MMLFLYQITFRIRTFLQNKMIISVVVLYTLCFLCASFTQFFFHDCLWLRWASFLDKPKKNIMFVPVVSAVREILAVFLVWSTKFSLLHMLRPKCAKSQRDNTSSQTNDLSIMDNKLLSSVVIFSKTVLIFKLIENSL